ncbi:MAG TPA: UDP-N-acetylmuramoyl-L-alanyl-D-glutamate--2,6-diaminopimelate ligase [Ignavibacteria bacterium]|nr:UDP-N-acetylmuramoyl-L-alanyl-D-glutamate--2,6-diaminopimelate ligase [Ignavibacteria bacterium]
MKFSELIKNISSVKTQCENDFEVEGLAYDSRNVKNNFVFFAIKGFKMDGNKFIDMAIQKGAKAVVSSEKVNMKNFVITENVRQAMAEMSCAFYDNPSQKLNLIGVTGTNGKTTTTYLLKKIFETSGYKTGLMGTIDYLFGDKKVDSKLTTPESIEINYMLNEMVKANITHCVMEVSSVALELKRVHGLKFKAGIFTNLTSEHLDFHKTMPNYYNAKKILFDELPAESIAISNKDDSYGENILGDCKAQKYFYSIENPSEFKAENISIDTTGMEFNVNINNSKYYFETSMTGKFNVYNCLAAISTSVPMGIKVEKIQKALKDIEPVNGRFNIIKLPNNASAIIDYSHTSDSLKNAIEAAIEIISDRGRSGRVITIFGCGGNRDTTKRPVMGNIATELSDYVIITSDNPRLENPDAIIKEIVAGIHEKNNFETIANREEAIKRGMEISQTGDLILICGKGHETYQEINGVKNHFDDREMVEKYSNLAKN